VVNSQIIFMKKLLIVVFLFISLASFSQISFGLKAGANISNFTGGDFDDVKKKALVGFHGGAYLRISLLRFSLQPEAIVSTQGAKIEDGSGDSHNWKITYANIPVMLQYRMGLGFYVEAGPQFGFKLGDNMEDQTIGDFARDLDLSAALGLGLRTKKGLGVGARYTAGLSKVGDFEPSSGVDPDFKNAVVQLSLYIPL
jgi:hypothetical protein